jgi:hypothetical protein
MAGLSPVAAIPSGLIQPAPAAPLAQVNAAMSAALGAAPAAAAAPAAPGETPQLEVPSEFAARLAKALAEGIGDGVQFAHEHAPGERAMITDWVQLKLPFPPKSDAEDLAYLHKIAASRTPEGIAAAQAWAKRGLSEEWEQLLEQYTKHVGPAQAREARKLMHDALMLTNSATQVTKASSNRTRPFVVDPTLELAVDKPGNNPSYPSGHASAAFAACLVLAHLMPDRKAEFMAIAHQAAWARVYAGVHFPTDVLAGARLAGTVATHVIRTSHATPIRGTGQGKNPGVAGGRHAAPAVRQALPGAVHLAGTPIGPPGPMPSAAAEVMGQGQPGT